MGGLIADNMMKKKLLICGATGFLGRNIAGRFAENPDFEVTGTFFKSSPWENQNVDMVYADLTKKDDVERVVKGKDIVVQMAATTSGARDIVQRAHIHVTDNAIMNSLLLRAVFDYNISHFLFPSCTNLYPSSEIPIKEDSLIEINKNYFGSASTKHYIEEMSRFFSERSKTKYTIIRQSNIYGPYDKFDLDKSHVFGATITKIVNAPENGEIIVWGDGQEKRDLLYVSDLTDFIESAIDKQKSPLEIFNAGIGYAISIDSLVKKIRHLAEREDLKIVYDSTKPTIKTNICLDCTKARNKIGWQPKISLDEGIEKTISWYRLNIRGVI